MGCLIFIGAFVLVGSVIGGSSIGVISNFIPAKNVMVKNAWRSGLNVFFFAIPTLIEYIYHKRKGTIKYADNFTFKFYLFLLLSLAMQVLWTTGLIYASVNTIQAHAYTFNNVHGLFIIFINVFFGIKPVKYEYIGISLAIAGCLFLVFDPSAQKADGTSPSITVALIDLGSAIFGAFYFVMNAKNVQSLPICFLIFLLNLHTFFLNYAIARAFFDKNVVLFSTDPQNGCLGFLSKEAALIAFLPYGILGSFFGSAGYVISLLFYSPVVTSNAFLVEPFMA